MRLCMIRLEMDLVIAIRISVILIAVAAALRALDADYLRTSDAG